MFADGLWIGLNGMTEGFTMVYPIKKRATSGDPWEAEDCEDQRQWHGVSWAQGCARAGSVDFWPESGPFGPTGIS